MGAPRDRPDQLGGQVGAVLVELSGPAAVIRFAVIVLPFTAPLTCTALPTGKCCAVLGVRLVPNCVCGVMVTVYAVPFLALTVQVEPFSAAIVPTSPWPWPVLAGAAAAGGAVDVGGAVVAGVALGLFDPPEHAATPEPASRAWEASGQASLLGLDPRMNHVLRHRCTLDPGAGAGASRGAGGQLAVRVVQLG
ncbi:MAG TPA: hypothetical protein VF003_04425 [Pseudonocardiaceae bacterium]